MNYPLLGGISDTRNSLKGPSGPCVSGLANVSVITNNDTVLLCNANPYSQDRREKWREQQPPSLPLPESPCPSQRGLVQILKISINN